VAEPFQGLSFSADWYDLQVKESITNGIAPATVLADVVQFGHLITRAAPDSQFPSLPGRIVSIDQRYINIGEVQIQGIDVNLQYRFPAMKYGRVRLSLSGSYYLKYDVEQIDGSFAGFVSNTLGSPVTGVSPRWKSYQSVSWEHGSWTAVLGNSYQSSYTDAALDLIGNERTVSSMTLWDAQVIYKGFRNLALTLGARNLLDTDPPHTNQANSFQAGFDPSYYDPRARVIYVSATYSFK
jgi:iron complex outermembrane receptor protein